MPIRRLLLISPTLPIAADRRSQACVCGRRPRPPVPRSLLVSFCLARVCCVKGHSRPRIRSDPIRSDPIRSVPIRSVPTWPPARSVSSISPLLLRMQNQPPSPLPKLLTLASRAYEATNPAQLTSSSTMVRERDRLTHLQEVKMRYHMWAADIAKRRANTLIQSSSRLCRV